MLCFVMHGIGDLRAEEHPVPTPGQGQALVRIAGCAICHTDLAVLEGSYPTPRLPNILGHEYAGTVVAVGPGVTGVAVDDRVTVYHAPPCGFCPACRRGDQMSCSNRPGLSGGFAELPAAIALRRQSVGVKALVIP